MVNGDRRLGAASAALLAALLPCGCLQTRPGDGLLRAPPLVGRGPAKEAVAADDSAVAIARPAKPGAAQTASAAPPGASAAAEGPELNPVQQTSAKSEGPAVEQPSRPDLQPANPPTQTPPAAPPPGGAPAPMPTGAPAPPPAPGHHAPEVAPAPRKLPPSPPGSAGLVQPGVLPPDPHQRPVPTAAGALLNLAPGESLAERALQLSARLAEADAERLALELRARELGAALEARDRVLLEHGREIHAAAEEVSLAREQVAAWRKELEQSRAKLRGRDQEDVQTLKAIIVLLERLTDAGSGSEGRRGGAPAKVPED